MKIKKGQTLEIKFVNNFPLPLSGLFTVENILNKTTFLVCSKNGHSVILDIKEHGKTYTVISAN